MKQFLFLLAAVISGNQLQAQADTTAKTLDETVVTASKTPVKQSQTGKVVTVIGKEQLEQIRCAERTANAARNAYITSQFENAAKITGD